MKKKFHLSITDFAIASPLTGSIDTYSGYGVGSEVGIQLHKDIQAQRVKEYPSYEKEVYVKHAFKYKKTLFEVRGRMDGMYQTEKTTIEEIKSAFNVMGLYHYINEHISNHPYCLQLLTYGYLHWLKTKSIPLLNLHLVSSRNKKSVDIPLILDIPEYESWLNRRLKELSKEVLMTEKRIKSRQHTASELTFPFSHPRPGQKELIDVLQDGLLNNQPLLIQAPTGLGKTIGILFPALKESLSRGQKVIYVTPKNSQHLVAEDALKKIQVEHLTRAMTITAKSKLCFKSQMICNSEYCEFAKDYYKKLTDNKIINQLKKITNLTAHHFKSLGLKYQVCPYELQMDNIANVDTIICDYNYVFSPKAMINRVGKLFLGETEKPNLVIDEFHNLPERGMGYYSPTLSAFVLKQWILECDRVDSRFSQRLKEILAECSQIILSTGLKDIKSPHKIQPPFTTFRDMETKLKEFLGEYLESDVTITKDDIVLKLFNYWSDFTSAIAFIDESPNEFFISYYPVDLAIRITCCNASAMLQFCYDFYHRVVGFSATLKPFSYYKHLSGLANKNVKTLELISPFPKHKRKLIVIPQVSSKYTERLRNYPRIAEAIYKITHLKKGNYFIFFPSFDFLSQVHRLYLDSSDFKIICQTRSMSMKDIQTLLTQLRESNDSHLIFAVQGGALSEGVDYPGNMIIGAIIIGVPLPLFHWEREQMKIYYEEKYQAGLDYAYIFPAMAKSIQSSGRVIRSELDTGIIVLIDPRFLQDSYSKCMPQDWFSAVPTELLSTGILKEITEFWEDTRQHS